MKKSKLKTPAWILEGYDSEAEYNKAHGKTEEKKKGWVFKISKCPKCRSDDVRVILSGNNGEEGGGKEWECRKCGWKGEDIFKEELNEDEFMRYLDNRGEEVI